MNPTNPQKVLLGYGLHAYRIAEDTMKEAKKLDDNDDTKKEKIEQAEREKNAANALLEGNIDKAFSSLCYFRDR